MTADIQTAQTRSHKSKFCPVRNRPKFCNFQNDNKRTNKNFQDISKLQIHFGLTLTALCTAFCILHCNCKSSLPELSVITQLASESKSISSNLCYKSLKQVSWLPIPNLYRRLPFSSNSKAFIVPCQRYSLGLYFRRMPASAFWR